MKRIIPILILAALAQSAWAQADYLRSFMEQTPFLHFGDESELHGDFVSEVGSGHRCGGSTDPHMILQERVLNSDFCLTEEISRSIVRPILNPDERWIGIAGIAARVHQGFYGVDTDSVEQIWFHVDVPGKLRYAETKFRFDDLAGKVLLILGARENGFNLVVPDAVFLVDNKNKLTDIHGKPLDSAFLWDLIETRSREQGRPDQHERDR